jgi:hypothetical protein
MLSCNLKLLMLVIVVGDLKPVLAGEYCNNTVGTSKWCSCKCCTSFSSSCCYSSCTDLSYDLDDSYKIWIPIVALFLIVGTIAGVLSIRRYRFQVVRRPVHVPAVVVTTTTQQQTSAQPVPLSEKAPAGYPVTGHPIPYPDPATK